MKKIILCVLLCVCLSGCSKKGAIFSAPDETLIKENPPLTVPPDYTLRPPVQK